jgi:hypothetical protein
MCRDENELSTCGKVREVIGITGESNILNRCDPLAKFL